MWRRLHIYIFFFELFLGQITYAHYNTLTQINHWPTENNVLFRIRIILITRYYYLLPKRSIYILPFHPHHIFLKRVKNDTTSPYIIQRTDNVVSTKCFAIFYDWFFFPYDALTMTHRVLDPETKNYTQNAFTVGQGLRGYIRITSMLTNFQPKWSTHIGVRTIRSGCLNNRLLVRRKMWRIL